MFLSRRRASPQVQERPGPASRQEPRLHLCLLALAQPLQPVVATELVRMLVQCRAPIGLQIVACADRVEVGISCAPSYGGEVARLLRGVVPTWEPEQSKLPPVPADVLHLGCRIGSAERVDWQPLCEVSALSAGDPLSALLEAVMPLAVDEQLTIHYALRPMPAARQEKAGAALTVLAVTPGVGGLLARALELGPRVARFEPTLQRALEERLSKPAVEVVGTLTLSGRACDRLISRARTLEAVFQRCFDAGFGGLSLTSWSWHSCPATDTPLLWPADISYHHSDRTADQRADHHPDETRQSASLYLTYGELAALWHVPSQGVMIAGMARLQRPSLPLPLPARHAAGGLLMGIHRERGEEIPVYLPRADLQAGHAILVGRTGMGKTTLAHQMIRQLAVAPDQPGLALIDPHGDFSRDVAARSIPPERIAETLLLELGDSEFPVSLPLFETTPGVPPEIAVEMSFALLRLLFREQWSPTRMEDAVFALSATLCQMPEATLLDVPRLLTDSAFRRRATASLTDEIARAFWVDYETLSAGSQREMTRPILYRLRSLYRSRAVRNIVCQRQGVDIGALLDAGRILLISLAGSAIQAEADLLGELIIARVHLAALARLERPATERKPCVLFVDESQRYRGASLPILLREGRKTGIALILATQYLDAWGAELAESVLGTVSTILSFACGPDDSRRLSSRLAPVSREQLENLDRFEIIAKMQKDGVNLPAFDVATGRLDARADDVVVQRLRTQTRDRYARPRRAVEEEIARSGLSLASAPSMDGWTEGGVVDEE